MAIKKDSIQSRRILVHGDTDFILEIPGDVRMTFGPWSPPSDKGRMERMGERALTGTLRLYKGTATAPNIVGLYSNVSSFRDLDAIKHDTQHPLPICQLCKQNLIEPGDDLCSKCNGHAEQGNPKNKKSGGPLVF